MRKFITVVILTTMFFFTLASGIDSHIYVNAETSSQENIDEIKEEIAEHEEMIELLNEDIDQRLRRIDELDEELSRTERELNRTELRLKQAQERLDENTEQFAGRVRSAYMRGGSSYIEILLDADNFGDLIVRLAYLTRILNRDADLIGAIREEREHIEQQQLAMEEQREKIEDRRYQMEAERRNLEEQRKTVNALLETSQENLEEELAQVPQTEPNPIYGVVYDNSPNARPQHGISQASLVYEHEVEGRATRYLALFSTLPSKVGPIRSAREHSTKLAWENDVNFVYASASRDNLERIEKWGLSRTNALYHSAFYRDSNRRAPHNLYVNLSTLNTARPSSGSVVRPGNISRQGNTGNSTSIQYSNSYRVSYQYNAKQGAYRRMINGEPHRDATGEQIWARNVIIQYTDHPTDWRRRTTPQLVGEGSIDFYSMGQHFTGTWKKDSPSSPTRFYYDDGQEIERVYGQTWVQIARP
ncbi:DUF3048 domain-containing protein [Proteinivorax hydrogeniformans]|uniref:DUF3048 domain-containing protein n=1 Tax=Proteinivorax hydrogeniformans TaxID=1826727 RepID=A0AAU8HWR6_9FIRM